MRFVILILLVQFTSNADAYEYYYVSTGSLNIREEPNSHSNVIGVLLIRDSVQMILLKEHGWSYILTKDGLDGYVSTKYLVKNKNEIATLNETHKNEKQDKSKGEAETSPTTILLLIAGFIFAMYMAFFRKKSSGGITSTTNSKAKPIFWFQCTRCGVTLRQNNTPSTLGCPSEKVHRWYKLAEVGNVNYQCKHCGTDIYSISMPSTLGCPSHEKVHRWYKL